MRSYRTMIGSPLLLAGALLMGTGCSTAPQGEGPSSSDVETTPLENPNPNPPKVQLALTPIVECIDVTTPGSAYVAHFGFTNAGAPITLPATAALDGFSPAPVNRGQPTTFASGTFHDVFQVSFDGSPLTWKLGVNSATVSSATPVCAPVGQCPASCDDQNPCTTDTCSATTSFLCAHAPVADGSSCTDGNACNGAEVCQAGACTAGTAVTCAASDQCHAAGVCNPATGACSNPPVVDGTACNDSNACTQSDSCQAGTCTGASPVTCAAADACHTAGVCDPNSGACSNPAVADGTSCSDGNACNGSEICLVGACTAGMPVFCSAPDQCHTGGSCDPISGSCSLTPVPNGTPCNDGNAGTLNDSCQMGVCLGGTTVTCTAIDACHTAGVVDPVTGVCSNPIVANGTSCSDGNACNGSESCQAGTCTAGTPVVCPAPDQCHVAGSCNSATGACSVVPVADGTACNDGNPATVNETCQAGVCNGGTAVVCTALDACHTAGVFNPATGACTNPVVADGTSCADSDACNGAEVCKAGACTAGVAVTCAAPDQCHTAGTCNPATGACSNPAAADGTACNDGSACTQTDSCQAGVCQGANPKTCTASDQCHAAGVCDPTSGACSNPTVSDGTMCNDGNACTQTDSCQAGTCQGASPVTCTALDSCHVAGVCNSATGTCSNPAAANGTTCNDGNSCTQIDSCQAGTCTGASPVTCTAADQCHAAGVCIPATGTCSNPAVTDGTTCNDGNGCTQTDSCQAGTCTGASPVTCTASDSCHVAGVCNAATGTCSNPAATDGTACNDNNGCTQADTCVAGACTGANPVTCAAPDQCHTAGACSPASGLCSNPAVADGTACTDNNGCTQNDACISGVCSAGLAVVCSPDAGCTQPGTCNPLTGTCGPSPVASCSTPCASQAWAHGYDTPLVGNVAFDPAGSLYVTGGFATTVDLGTGPLSTAGGSDIYIAKLNPATGTAAYALRFGDDVDQNAVNITADAAGHFAVTGTYIGTLAFGGSAATLSSSVDSVFVAGFDAATGNALWAKNVNLGGGAIGGIATDPTDGGVVVAGFAGTNATADFGSGPLLSGGGRDVVVAKYAAATGALVWAKQYGGLADQRALAVTVDSAGKIYVTGQYAGTIDFGNGALPNASGAKRNIFVAGLSNVNGVGTVSRSISSAGTQQQQAVAIATDAAGDVIIGGAIAGTVSFGTNTLVSAGGQDAFAAKLAPDLSTVWAVRFGDALSQNTNGVAVDSAGNVTVAGSYQGAIDASPVATLTSAGAFDAFAIKLDGATGAVQCAKSAGDFADQTAARVTINPATDSEYLLGTFISSVDWGGGAITGSLTSSQTYLVKLQ